MKPPPKLPTKLLERLTTGPRRESIIGDLTEAYRNGRSTAWYWRQALTAILWEVVGGIRDHKLLALRAVITGAACTVVFSVMTHPFVYALFVLRNGGIYVGQDWIVLSQGTVRVLWLANDCIGFAISGWIVGRLHRDRPAPMLLAYLTLVFVFLSVQFVQMIVVAWTDRSGVVHRFDFQFIRFAAILFSALLGGLWGARPEGQLSVESD